LYPESSEKAGTREEDREASAVGGGEPPRAPGRCENPV